LAVSRPHLHTKHSDNIPIPRSTTVQHRRYNDGVTEVQLEMDAQFHRHDCGGCLDLGLAVVVVIFIVIISS